MTDKKRKVFLGVPTYNGELMAETVEGIMRAGTSFDVLIKIAGSSLLAHNFNKLWAEALNTREEHGWTHFAMIHADIGPEPLWLDKLLDEMEYQQADLISAVVPMKHPYGMTSTGICDRPQGPVRRLTLKETHACPDTFNAELAGFPDTKQLVVNTGLWACRFDQPWVEKVKFEIRDELRKNAETGKWEAQVFSEDWHFSALCQSLGVRLCATHVVKLRHFGRDSWRNDIVYGVDSDCGQDQRQIFSFGEQYDREHRFAEAVEPAERSATERLIITGWMGSAEQQALKQLAAGKDVLEIGAYEGLSTACLASTAKHVTTIDTFDGRGTPLPKSTRSAFDRHIAALNLRDKVRVIEAESAAALAGLNWEGAEFDLCFIDGSHDYESVKADAEACSKLLRPDGILLFHDYRPDDPLDPGVVRAVDELLAAGARRIAQCESLLLVAPSRESAELQPA